MCITAVSINSMHLLPVDDARRTRMRVTIILDVFLTSSASPCATICYPYAILQTWYNRLRVMTLYAHLLELEFPGIYYAVLYHIRATIFLISQYTSRSLMLSWLKWYCRACFCCVTHVASHRLEGLHMLCMFRNARWKNNPEWSTLTENTRPASKIREHSFCKTRTGYTTCIACSVLKSS